jgi:hypothetical protein
MGRCSSVAAEVYSYRPAIPASGYGCCRPVQGTFTTGPIHAEPSPFTVTHLQGVSIMTRCLIENLEGRRMMDATMPLEPVAQDRAVPATEVDFHTHAVTRGAVPNLAGTWQGSIAVGGGYIPGVNFRLQVAKQTKTTLTGTITIGEQTYKGTGTLRWSGRNFTVRYASKGGVSLMLQGTVNANGKSMFATATAMGRVIGHMDAAKVT